MRMKRFLIVLSVFAAGALVTLAVQRGPTSAQTAMPVVRAQAIELVDGAGQVRAAFTVESNGETVLRLRDADGTIRVKLGASKDGSALLLVDGSTEPGLHVLSRRTGTTLTVRGEDGKLHPIKP